MSEDERRMAGLERRVDELTKLVGMLMGNLIAVETIAINRAADDCADPAPRHRLLDGMEQLYAILLASEARSEYIEAFEATQGMLWTGIVARLAVLGDVSSANEVSSCSNTRSDL